MKKLLIISFDLIRAGESKKSLAIASIMSYLKNDKRYGIDFLVEHFSINMFEIIKKTDRNDFFSGLFTYNFEDIDFVAISAYIWNEYLTNDLINYLRIDLGYSGNIILGGYQISYSSSPENEYPDCQYYVSGYAEQSLLKILIEKTELKRISSTVNFLEIPSPYLKGELPINKKQEMVRLETKRGCPYSCSFCAHRDLTTKRVYKHDLDKVYKEIAYFCEKSVGKVNIIDPIFNMGTDYLSILSEMCRINFSSLVSMQVRFELIKGDRGKLFLDLCENLNTRLEFGLQTALLSESKLINRQNNQEVIERVMKELKTRGLSYEISLIYGLPNQTLDSFQYSIDFAFNNGCENVTAYPLMLLKGTELYEQKQSFGFREKKSGEFNIPVVIESNTFSENDWYSMKSLAEQLNMNDRV